VEESVTTVSGCTCGLETNFYAVESESKWCFYVRDAEGQTVAASDQKHCELIAWALNKADPDIMNGPCVIHTPLREHERLTWREEDDA
jgi:hypothetical protein